MLLNAHNDRAEWESRGLKEFGDYAESVEYVYDQPDYEGSNRGEWFYADDETQTLYTGTYGNDHSPGASMYTWAEIFTDADIYRFHVDKWNKAPAYVE